MVDDEVAPMRALCSTLPDHGYEPIGFMDAEAALAQLRHAKCDLLLADLMMPGMDGIALLKAAEKMDPELVGIIMTGAGTISTAVEAMKSGALDYILKPFKLSFIIPVLERALAVRRLRLENAELARRVHERTLELETANKELDAFSHSVAHDLRSPLTVIIGSADTLIEDYSAQLPGPAQELLRTILTGGEHMQRLTDGLLRLSRLGRQSLSRHSVDVTTIVQDVLAELHRAHRGHPVAVRLGELPGCVGDAALLRQVVANLLSNAFKFTRQKESPVVEVAGWIEAGERIYSVRDNGAGFDMAQTERLFGAFQRLHSLEQYEGTGIGLSIAARIVRRHGGRIWAEAELEKGATFRFSIPD